MDRSGYYEAEVSGRAGLVPANYLQPLHERSQIREYNIDPWVSHTQRDNRPEQIVNIHRWLQQELPKQHKGRKNKWKHL